MNPTVSSPKNAPAVGAASPGPACPGSGHPGVPGPGAAASEPRRRAVARVRMPGALSFRNIGALYVWLAIAVIFTLWAPSTFPTWTTARQILDENAATGLMALSVVIPLCTRTFDLSVGFIASLSAVTASYMIAHGVPVAAAVAIAMGGALLVGLINAGVVVVMGVDSFIATLATGSLIQAFITLMTNDIAITSPKLAGPFAKIGQASIGGITLPVIYTLLVALVIWFVLEHTATGRRLYATGFNPESARLAGVRTARLRFASLIVSALLAGAAGVILASTLGSGDPQAGVPYLLSAYAAAFLGASQLRPGRFNAWGTLIAVLLLGTGVVGLGLVSAPNWAPAMFTGVVLIAALGITGAKRRALRKGQRRGLRFGRRRAATGLPSRT
jgi:ribose/xylose/arabinose/galactoside ABC-type transport system permease subunit